MYIMLTCSIISALCVIFLALRVWKLFRAKEGLRCRASKLNRKLRTQQRDIEDLQRRIKTLCDNIVRWNKAAYAAAAEFYTEDAIDGSVVVFRRVEVDGYGYVTVIKRFNDEDTAFNQREAESLCDMLNSK